MSATLDTPVSTGTGPHSGFFTRNAWLVAGGLALTGLGLAAGLAWRPAPQTELLQPGSLEATRASLASNEAVIDAGGKPASDKPVEPSAERPAQGTPVPPAANT